MKNDSNCSPMIEQYSEYIKDGIATIPVGVSRIVDHAFAGCTYLVGVIIPPTVTYIGQGAFSRCTRLKYFNIPTSVKYIGGGAFYGCTSLLRGYFPNTAMKVGQGIFADCTSLSYVSFMGSIDSIPDYTFSACKSLTHIDVSGPVSIGANAFDGCYNLTQAPPLKNGIGAYAFRGCIGLKNFVIPVSVNSIGKGAFIRCSNLCQIEVSQDHRCFQSKNNCLLQNGTLIWGCSQSIIPSTVSMIGPCAFEGCEQLSSIVIPDSVTKIGERAFQDCVGLEHIIIPNSVLSIGIKAFKGCTNLCSIELSCPDWDTGRGAFENCCGVKELLVHINEPSSIQLLLDALTSLKVIHTPYRTGHLYKSHPSFTKYTIIDDL